MSDYHKLSIDEKRRQTLSSAREPAIMCPICDMQVTPADLVVHVEHRCTGPRTPGASAKWATFREAIRYGASSRMLTYWTATGTVRVTGTRGEQRYLVRDLALCIARLKGRRRR